MKTKEGFELKNVKTFPSMEYGDNGGISCDIYLNDKKIISYFDAGNGGEADIKFEPNVDEQKVKDLAYTTSKRLSVSGGSMQNANDAILKLCALDSLVDCLVDKIEDEKHYKKYAKRGYTYMLSAVWHGFKKLYAASSIDQEADLVDFMCKDQKIRKEDLEVNYFTSIADFANI